ncbi:hypothetical protein ABB37_06753, partial [Leptomonas pyrrhocoris]
MSVSNLPTPPISTSTSSATSVGATATPGSATPAATSPAAPPLAGAPVTRPPPAAPLSERAASFREAVTQLEELRNSGMLGGEQYVTLVDSLTRQYLNPTTPTTAAATTFSGGMDSTLSWDVSVMSRENYVRMYPWAPEYVKAKLGLTRIEQEYAE